MRVHGYALLLLAVSAVPVEAKVDDLPAFARAYLDKQTHAVLPTRDARTSPLVEPLSLTRMPSFARQTGLACSTCHYQFPQLTPFGRQFKLNGYTMSGLKAIEGKDKNDKPTLALLPFSPLSVMVQSSATQLSTALPGTQNFTVALPQQFGLIWAGAISTNLGAFAQLTWSQSAGSVEIDNVDIRYASRGAIGDTPLTWGVTLNNNPTVQDLWNTTPAWGYPFASSATTPGPLGGQLIMGGLAQRSVGLGIYALWNDLVYTELAAYRPAVPGAVAPLDSSARSTISGFTPYWRVALQKTFGTQYLMLGTYGLSAKLFPAGISGPTDDFTDIALDAQHEMPVGDGHLVTRVAWINESQTFGSGILSGAVANRTNSLNTLRLSSSWYPNQNMGLTLSLFNTSAARVDTLLYAPASVTGSAVGSPETTGGSIEASYNMWENARISMTYTLYSKFNGRDSNYDGAGRNASMNNSLYLLWWFAF